MNPALRPQGPDVWEYVLIGAMAVCFVMALRSCIPGAHGAVDCKPRLIGFIEKCDVTGCRVQLADGTYGMGKLPLEFGKVSEVCQ